MNLEKPYGALYMNSATTRAWSLAIWLVKDRIHFTHDGQASHSMDINIQACSLDKIQYQHFAPSIMLPHCIAPLDARLSLADRRLMLPCSDDAAWSRVANS